MTTVAERTVDPGTRQDEQRPKRRASFNVAAHGLRGVASLMVFFAHLLGGTAEHIYPNNQAYVQGLAPFWNVGTFGVCLFFVISGFVILPSAMRYSPGEFAGRRFMRIYPLFFAFSLLFIVLNAATGFDPDRNNLKSIIAGLTFTDLIFKTEQLTPNAWSLTYEIWFYALTAAAVYCALRRRSVFWSLVVGAAALSFLLHYPLSLYFLAGAGVRIAYDHADQLRNGRHWFAELLALTACLFLASRGHYDDYEWRVFRDPGVPLLIVSTTIYFALAVSSRSATSAALGNPLFRYLGAVSYSLYLVHPYTYLLVRVSFVDAGLFSANVLVSMTLFIAVATVVTMAATHLVYHSLERWPYERFYGQKIYRAAAEAPGADSKIGTAATRTARSA